MRLAGRLPPQQAPTHPPPAVSRRSVEATAATRRSGRRAPAASAASPRHRRSTWMPAMFTAAAAAATSRVHSSATPTRRLNSQGSRRQASRLMAHRSAASELPAAGRAVVSPSKTPREPAARVLWRWTIAIAAVAGQRAAQLQLGLEVVDLLLQRPALLVDRPHGQLVGGDVRLLLAGQQRALQQQGLLQHARQRRLRRQALAQHVLVGFVTQGLDHAAGDRQRAAAGRVEIGSASSTGRPTPAPAAPASLVSYSSWITGVRPTPGVVWVFVQFSQVRCSRSPSTRFAKAAAAPGDDQVWQVRRLPQALRASDDVSVALRPLSRL
jgi:hypothetical protein